MQTKERRFLILLVFVTIFVRGGVLVVQRDRLNEDIDGYRGIAKQLADGNGYAQPDTGNPTAFRPPLYPLLIALTIVLHAGNVGIIFSHLLMGVATVVLTWRLGKRLTPQYSDATQTGIVQRKSLTKTSLGVLQHSDPSQPNRRVPLSQWMRQNGPLVAAWIIALDPLLIQYTTFSMTETLCTFLAVLALNFLVPIPRTKSKQFVLGFVLGLCVLSRPTFLVFAGLGALIWSWQVWRHEGIKRIPWAMPLGLLLVISPWMVRNAMIFGSPRVTTTHGGYTLLLGNNPVFYKEVVLKPWGSAWDGESLARWQESLEAEMSQAVPPVQTEVERDRWMSQKARQQIADNPGVFLRSCVLRFFRFWNVLPPKSALDTVAKIWKRGCASLGLNAWQSAAKTITQVVAVGVAVCYGLLILSFVIGCVRLRRTEWSNWWPLVLMIACFCSVHLVYWSNTRMRAPVMPAVVLLAVRAWSSAPSKGDDESAHS